MSLNDHDFGGPHKFATHTMSAILASKPQVDIILEHFLDGGTTLRALVEKGVNHREFLLLLAVSMACGKHFGIYRCPAPRKVQLISCGHFAADWHRLSVISKMPAFADAQALLERNLSIYHRDHEKDPLVDLGYQPHQEAMKRSMPKGTDVVIVDWVPGFMRKPMGRLQPIPPYGWFNSLNDQGIAVVAFDRLERTDLDTPTEAVAASTAFLTVDVNASSQFGGGFLIERGRVGDADYAMRKASFWHTEIGGELEYGFDLPDPDDLAKPVDTRKDERFIKLELMLATGDHMLKDIAAEFKVHKSTITRWKQELEKGSTEAAQAALLDPNSSHNRWESPPPLGQVVRIERREQRKRAGGES